MADLGKCLLFFLKYPAEMERLYESDNPKLDGLPSPVELEEKIKRVGDTASKEAADFLENCKEPIYKRFSAISSVRQKRSDMKQTWELAFRVAPRPRKTVVRDFWIGVSFNSNRQALHPWVWSHGGRRATDEILRILDTGERATKFGCTTTSVVLKEIKIQIPDRFDKPVECDSLVKQVDEAFESFTAQKVKEIAAIATK